MGEPFVWVVTICSSVLSIIGGLFIIYTYSAIPAVRNSSRQLLVCLTVADIATAYGNIVGSVRFAVGNGTNTISDGLCVAQSFVTTMSSLCSFVWTSLIALHLLLLVICNGNDIFQVSKKIKILFHLLGWGLPGLITGITLCMGKLGDDNSELSGSWCWIKGTDEIDKILWSLISGKGWEIFTYVFTTSLYILLKGFTIRKRKREPDFDWSKITKNLRKEDENFCMAFMILYIARLWGTIRFFLVVFGVKNNSIDRILIYLHSYGDSAQAFWNCILYCFSLLSIIGGFLIIYTYTVISAIQNSTREMLVCLTIADIGNAFGNLVGAIRFAVYYYHTNTYVFPSDELCVTQSFVTTFSSLSSFVWTTLIALHLFLLVMHNGNDIYRTSKLAKIVFHISGWCLPGLIGIVAVSIGKLGEDKSQVSGGWCWISGDLTWKDKLFWMIFAGKGWEILTYVMTTNLYILLKFFTYRKRRREPDFHWGIISSGRLRTEDENFCMAFVVLYLARLWGTIRFFMSILNTTYSPGLDQADSILVYFHSYGDSAQAFWNFIKLSDNISYREVEIHVISAIQNSTREMLVCLTIADIATAFGNLVGALRFAVYYYRTHTNEFPPDVLCVAQSVVTTCSSLSSFVWNSMIAIHLFVLVIYNGNDMYRTSKLAKIVFHISGWCLPGLIVIVAVSMGKLGEDKSQVSGGWCWISGDLTWKDKLFWMLFTGKGWELLTYMMTMNLYILLKFFTYRRRRREPDFHWGIINSGRLRTEDENFCMAFAILYLVRIWGTIRFFMSILNTRYSPGLNQADSILVYFHSYGDSAQAFWNFVLYCLLDKTLLANQSSQNEKEININLKKY
ncbi:hypothetical protein KUTeg_002042 [Tegillarca granosa]|uniref:G-protein coupled receptors family 2 profile 2 domain-containing protein n=1 Tax=Tegillarca granosa TaxID=220873 RepID=A0ABQ9FVY8_TEGGR|nr:hypothetical protein KUTeg_002042 [Tegillarca granosa]